MEEWPFEDDPPNLLIEGRDYGHEIPLSPQDTRGHPFIKCKFLKTPLVGAEACWFTNCEFQDCTLARSVSHVAFSGCSHIRSDFSDTQLADVCFADCKMIKASFSRSTVFNEVTLCDVTGLHTSQRLHEVKLTRLGGAVQAFTGGS
jgi:hypothetical protein